MPTTGLQEGGSAATETDAAPTVVIDRDDELDRMRYRCPNNHTRWVATNNHVYCHSCSRLADAGEGPNTTLQPHEGSSEPCSQMQDPATARGGFNPTKVHLKPCRISAAQRLYLTTEVQFFRRPPVV